MSTTKYYNARKHDLGNIRIEADPGNGMTVHGADDLGQTQDGRLERLALVLGVVGDKAQQQMRHQLVPRDRAVAVRVYLHYDKMRILAATSYLAARGLLM